MNESLTTNLDYLLLLRSVRDRGMVTKNRTNVETISLLNPFPISIEFLSANSFPLIAVRRTAVQSAIVEALWILKGLTNIAYLNAYNNNYWNKWADADGNLGPIYGKQLRDFNGIDQLKYVIDLLVNQPESRRILFSLWDPFSLKDSSIPPCHITYVFSVRKPYIYLTVFMRSLDLICGFPHDLVLANLFLYILGNIANYVPKRITYNIVDCHYYCNALSVVNKLLSLESKDLNNLNTPILSMPKLSSIEDIEQLEPLDFIVQNYNYIYKDKVVAVV